MSSHSLGQRLAEYLILRACRHFPHDVQSERYREWTAELPAILHDPDVRFAARRAARALWYAADHARGARKLAQKGSRGAVTRVPGELSAFTGLADLPAMRSWVAECAKQAGLSATRITDLVLSVSEIAHNTLLHTCSGGTVRVWHTETEILCQIDDIGNLADPAAALTSFWGSQPGHGIWLVRQICDLVDIGTSETGTTVRLGMRLLGTDDASGSAAPPRDGPAGGT